MTEKQIYIYIYLFKTEKIQAKGVFIIFDTDGGDGEKKINAFFSVFPLFNEIWGVGRGK